MEPHGRLRSRALRPPTGDLRVVLNVEDAGAGHAHPVGVNQVAFACADVRGRGRGAARRTAYP